MKNLGFVQIKKNPDQNWETYCSKDVDLMSQLLNQEGPLEPDSLLLKTIKYKKQNMKNCSKSKDITRITITDTDSSAQSETSSDSNSSLGPVDHNVRRGGA